VRFYILRHRQPPQELAPYESGKSSLGNPKNYISAKVVLE
jgi:NADH:ubiquinone oxidoreductase subunit 3 (subunit A)